MYRCLVETHFLFLTPEMIFFFPSKRKFGSNCPFVKTGITLWGKQFTRSVSRAIETFRPFGLAIPLAPGNRVRGSDLKEEAGGYAREDVLGRVVYKSEKPKTISA